MEKLSLTSTILLSFFFFLPKIGLTQCNPIPGLTTLGQFGSSCYYQSDDSFTWQNSLSFAQNFGGNLVSITADAENDFLLTNYISPDPWIGLNDIDQEGDWQWASGEQVSYTNWQNGQPNGQTNQNAAAFLNDGTWGDFAEDNLKPFILETALPLPVELITFTATNIGSTIVLEWQTTSETVNRKFIIEHSQSTDNFVQLGSVEAREKNAEQEAYSFIFSNPQAGINYFRLKQMDEDGQFDYSQVISVDVTEKYAHIGAFYPNPSRSGWVSIDYYAENSTQLKINVFDSVGRLVATQDQLITDGDNQLVLNLSQLEAGIYRIELESLKGINRTSLIIK
ncbi:MAG: lectin-like protein [Saprospiraceae bacterium]